MATQTKHLLLLLSLLILLGLAPKSSSQPNPDCPQECGALSIQYPFGTGDGCYLDSSFLINCTNTSNSNTPTPFLRRSNIVVLSISLDDGELRVSSEVTQVCYNESMDLVNRTRSGLNLSHFYVSSTRNKFVVVGCNTLALIESQNPQGKTYTTGCVSWCSSVSDIVANGSCSGTGCCQTSIPKGISGFSSAATDLTNDSTVPGFNPCGYAFVVEEEAFKFSSADLISFPNKTVPVVLDWAVGNQTCEEAQNNRTSFACKAEHSDCYNSTNGVGYRCNCSHGFEGNPYLIDGCQDVNECMGPNDCVDGACHNLIGSYECLCPERYKGDGKSSGTGCSPTSNSMRVHLLTIGLGVFLGSITLLGVWRLQKFLRRRAIKKQKEKFFKKNGGLLLQQKFFSGEVEVDRTKLFSLKDLEKATDRFNVNRVLGKGGQGTVYKGMLVDGRIVAVKKFKVQGKVEEFINEFVILSQINHRNVVRLLGCCLETEVPLLVYEFIPNGNLFQYLHEPNEDLPMTWNIRLRIASEVAGALFYLHSAACQPIYHRDIKSTNILLDEKYRAKIADFGASRMVSIDDTHLTTLVQGTLGYLDPEYFRTSQLSEKSDVYSFGVVLVELLTGQKPISSIRPEEAKSLAQYFISSLEENCLFDILDKRIMKEEEQEHIMAVANLAERCLNLDGKKRPTMKEVTMELEEIQKLGKKYNAHQNDEEINLTPIDPYYHPRATNTTSTGQSLDSTTSSSSEIMLR